MKPLPPALKEAARKSMWLPAMPCLLELKPREAIEEYAKLWWLAPIPSQR